MFYKIAIIQNEKEIFKYECADWNNLFKENIDFSFYRISYFDEHNIVNLFEKINEFDAVFFATNAFNSGVIYDTCEYNFQKLENYINSGKGVYIGYSSKNKKRTFLSEKYRIEQIERDFSAGESEMDGNLMFFSHPITNAHKTVSFLKYKDVATQHTTIAGLYFDYLDYDPEANGLYDTVVIDSDKNRPLMVCSKISTGTKVVVSTLPIDWQRQIELFTNIVKYCAEGEPSIKIVSNLNNSANDFSREYLSRQLNLYKRPFAYENVESLSDVVLSNNHYETIIFDCSWTDNEVDDFCERKSKDIYEENIRVLHYFNYGSAKKPIYKLTVHSAFQQIDLIEESVLIAIECRTPGSKDKFSYDSSLLSTHAAIKFLQANDIFNCDLYENIISIGRTRLLSDGSYDAMFIASCIFFSIWTMCDKNAKNDLQYSALKGYIISALFEKGENNISSQEKAQALLLLGNTDILNDSYKCNLLSCVIKHLFTVNQEDIFSYIISVCWLSFFQNLDMIKSNKLITEDGLNTLVKNLCNLLVNIKTDCKTVVLSNYINVLVSLIKNEVITQTNEKHTIHKLLFDAVGLVYEKRDGTLWNDDIYSSCCAIDCLKNFAELSSYPIDEILTLSQSNSMIFNFEQTVSDFDYSAILDSTTRQTNDLIQLRHELDEIISEKNSLISKLKQKEEDIKGLIDENNKINATLKEKNKEKRRQLISLYVGKLSILIALFFIIQMLYVWLNHKESFASYFSSFNSFLSWIFVGIGSIIPIFELINYIRRKK